MIGPNLERRILALERQVFRAGVRANDHERVTLPTLEQRGFAIWNYPFVASATNIAVVVYCEGGVPLSGATVDLLSSGGATLATITSGGSGDATFSAVTPGNYKVRVTGSGRLSVVSNTYTFGTGTTTVEAVSLLTTSKYTITDSVYGAWPAVLPSNNVSKFISWGANACGGASNTVFTMTLGLYGIAVPSFGSLATFTLGGTAGFWTATGTSLSGGSYAMTLPTPAGDPEWCGVDASVTITW